MFTVLRQLLKLGNVLTKQNKKLYRWRATKYIAHCSSGTNGFACFTGLSRCPIGRCGGSVYIPDTNE